MALDSVLKLHIETLTVTQSHAEAHKETFGVTASDS